ncbi:MAG: DAK2 domain-containing protein [Chloroflexota bacterium]
MDLEVDSSSRKTPPFDGRVLKQLTQAALHWLRTNQQTVNALNVFPVPDGDTGTNMVLTMQAACDEVASLDESNVGKVAHAIAHGALMGARGNSGVILSQVWRGFARALDSQETLDGSDLVRAFVTARETAYKGVVRPVEGTILTVARDVASAAEQALEQTGDPYEILERLVPAADISVNRTPELLPVLKQAGVVDSGGKGLFFILDGMARHLRGEPLEVASVAVQPLGAMQLDNPLEAIEPGQDYEVVVDFRPNESFDLEKFYSELETMGTSIQVGEGDGMYRMHIHVPLEKRYEPIDYTMKLGVITQVHLENLMAQMDDLKRVPKDVIPLTPVEADQIAVVVVAPGPGIARVFASLGAASLVEGGQTMNPSTGQLIDALKDLPTDKVIILPNNKNIILAAQSAVHAAAQMGIEKRIEVIPSRTVPQGLAAMLHLVPDGDLSAIVAQMNAALHDVQTIEITTATRSVEIDGVVVEDGQSIALLNGKLAVAAGNVEGVTLQALELAGAAGYELITLFSGNNITPDEVTQIVERIQAQYPDQELEVQDGGQAHYQFIISIE